MLKLLSELPSAWCHCWWRLCRCCVCALSDVLMRVHRSPNISNTFCCISDCQQLHLFFSDPWSPHLLPSAASRHSFWHIEEVKCTSPWLFNCWITLVKHEFWKSQVQNTHSIQKYLIFYWLYRELGGNNYSIRRCCQEDSRSCSQPAAIGGGRTARFFSCHCSFTCKGWAVHSPVMMQLPLTEGVTAPIVLLIHFWELWSCKHGIQSWASLAHQHSGSIHCLWFMVLVL